jgi:DNA-binding XRE family transcriptional regulator
MPLDFGLATWQHEEMKQRKTSTHPVWVWRTSRNIKQSVFAELVGVHKSTLNKIELQGKRPSLKVAVAIELATKGKVKAKELLPADTGQQAGEAA